jgi:ribonuclease T2
MAAAACCADARPAIFLRRVVQFAAAMLLAACAPAAADGASAAAKGSGFDFYVLSLSWSPSYCILEGAGADRRQCGGDRDFGFIVHGLWPQFERGYPSDCDSDEPERVPGELARMMADIMPSPGLVGHEWRTHGTCTGLSQRDYLAAVRAARERVRLPAAIERAGETVPSTPARIEKAFIAANRGLASTGIAVTCEGGMLDEVRICLTKDLDFRACPRVDRDACEAGSISVPAVR